MGSNKRKKSEKKKIINIKKVAVKIIFCAPGMFVFISRPTFVGRSRSEGRKLKKQMERKTERRGKKSIQR